MATFKKELFSDRQMQKFQQNVSDQFKSSKDLLDTRFKNEVVDYIYPRYFKVKENSSKDSDVAKFSRSGNGTVIKLYIAYAQFTIDVADYMEVLLFKANKEIGKYFIYSDSYDPVEINRTQRGGMVYVFLDEDKVKENIVYSIRTLGGSATGLLLEVFEV